VVDVVGGQSLFKAVDGRQCQFRPVELGNRGVPVEGDDRGGVEGDELVVEGENLPHRRFLHEEGAGDLGHGQAAEHV
jgi:hypothetical protein